MTPWRLHPARDIDLAGPGRWSSLRRECGLVSTALHAGFWTLTHTYLKLWHRLDIAGLDRLPAEPPFVLLANHTSHLDALAMAAPLPWRLRDRVFPIAAGDVFFNHPWKSALAAALVNALPMWRRNCGAQAIKELRRRLIDDPCILVLFPEGGRSRDGNLKPFRSGIGALLAETRVPAVPCGIIGGFGALPPGAHLPLPTPIHVTYGEPMTFEDAENGRAGWELIAGKLHAAVAALSAKVHEAA